MTEVDVADSQMAVASSQVQKVDQGKDWGCCYEYSSQQIWCKVHYPFLAIVNIMFWEKETKKCTST